MSGIPQPSPLVAVTLASLVIHADEALSPGAHAFDVQTFRALLADPDVQAYLAELKALALLPVRRSA